MHHTFMNTPPLSPPPPTSASICCHGNCVWSPLPSPSIWAPFVSPHFFPTLSLSFSTQMHTHTRDPLVCLLVLSPSSSTTSPFWRSHPSSLFSSSYLGETLGGFLRFVSFSAVSLLSRIHLSPFSSHQTSQHSFVCYIAFWIIHVMSLVTLVTRHQEVHCSYHADLVVSVYVCVCGGVVWGVTYGAPCNTIVEPSCNHVWWYISLLEVLRPDTFVPALF